MVLFDDCLGLLINHLVLVFHEIGSPFKVFQGKQKLDIKLLKIAVAILLDDASQIVTNLFKNHPDFLFYPDDEGLLHLIDFSCFGQLLILKVLVPFGDGMLDGKELIRDLRGLCHQKV